jgi:hypothetical protein
MADTLPTPPPVGAPITYRPLSGFAVCGFVLACLFALLVLIAAAVALYQGVPFFYSAWVLLIPASGLVLSLVARGQIRNAEGTRAGDALAKLGIGLSVMFGLGYFAYYHVTGLAITSQANAFLTEVQPDSGFFPHLVKAASSKTDLYAAFLLSLPVTERGTSRPEDHNSMQRLYDKSNVDGSAGPLTAFRNHTFVRLILTTPPDQITIEPLGVQGWEYESRSYRVRRTYRVTVPEGWVDFSVLVQSNEAEAAGEQRRWFVLLSRLYKPRDPNALKLTQLGEGLQKLRDGSRAKLEAWKTGMNSGDVFAFADVDQTRWSDVLPADEGEQFKKRLAALFASSDLHRLMGLNFLFQDEFLGGWKTTPDNKVLMEHLFRMPLEARGADPTYYVEGRIDVETKDPVDPRALRDNPANIEWVIRGITITRAAPVLAKKPSPRQ